jgi:hypothetical protein
VKELLKTTTEKIVTRSPASQGVACFQAKDFADLYSVTRRIVLGDLN